MEGRDWTPATIVSHVWNCGWTMRRLSTESGLRPGSLAFCLRHDWPRAEQIVAAAIGVAPERIWPSRYARRAQRARRRAAAR
ncbi:MAG: helix-turn-helix domain-containing protein [Candidatus Binatus sp.]